MQIDNFCFMYLINSFPQQQFFTQLPSPAAAPQIFLQKLFQVFNKQSPVFG